jgi:hypothetical protein
LFKLPFKMTHVLFTLLQLLLIPDLAKVVLDFVPDVELTYTDGSKRCLKAKDVNTDLKKVTHINVFTEFVITKETKFCAIVDISGVGVVRLVGDMSVKFGFCSSFNSCLNSWDTSECTDMSFMFQCCKNFNPQSLGPNFDTSKCTNMMYMFYGCHLFNSDLGSKFNTTNCTNMSNMFTRCHKFNPPSLGPNFATAKCTDMRLLFYECYEFNSLLGSKFITTNCTNMSNMFTRCHKFIPQSLSPLFQ